MHKIGLFTTITIFSLATAAVGSGLPPEVAEKLENAISFDESNDFVGTYRISISTLIQKPNGKGREESLIEADVIHRGNGEIERSLLKYIEGDLFMSHLVTDGLAKILLFKREFNMEMRFDDINRGEKDAQFAK